MESKALSLREQMDLGEVFYKSQLFSDLKSAAQAIVKIQAGAELGIPPFAAMSGIYVIEGKPALGAGLIAGRIKASGKYDYKIIRLDDTGCVIEFYEGKTKLGESSFTVEDAQKVLWKDRDGNMKPLTQKYNWRQFPRNMYFARTISNGARWFCPDISSGPIYTPEELGSEVVDAEYEVVNQPAPKADAPKQEPPQAGAPKQGPGNGKHWIDDDATRKRFWAYTRDTLGLSDKEVYAALGVEHVHDYAGDKAAAMTAIQEYVRREAGKDRVQRRAEELGADDQELAEIEQLAAEVGGEVA